MVATLASLLAAFSTHAQTPASETDDLELPAAPAGAVPSSPAPTPTPAEPAPEPAAPPPLANSAASPSAPVAPGAPATPAPAPVTASSPAPVAAEAQRVEGPVAAATKPPGGAGSNLERKAHERPVPDGLVIGGYLQAEFQANRLSEDQIQQGGELLNNDRFLLRRARLRLDHGSEYTAATLELDANSVRGPRVGIRRAEGALLYRGAENARVPLVMLSLGVTDLPFGFELNESSRARAFMERSLGSSALFPTEADVGLKLSGAISFFRYGVALTNGEPLDDRAPLEDPNAAKDVTGRVGVDVSPAKGWSIAGGTSFATGKGFHPGQQATKDTVLWRDDDDNGTVSLAEIVGVPGSAGSPSQNFERWVLGVDLGASFTTGLGMTRLYGEAFVASNYDRGFAAADPVAIGQDVRHTGFYAALVQDVTEYAFVGFRAALYDPNADVLEDRRGRLLPHEQSVWTFSPLVAFVLKDRARVSAQYDFVRDHLGRDDRGVPKDVKNDQFTARLQVDL